MFILVWLAALCLASAEGIETWFPTANLPHERAEQLLVPERIGPPATEYDHLPGTGRGFDFERAIEVQLVGGRTAELAPPDGLRRFGEVALELSREGRMTLPQLVFLAEHYGLAEVPEVAAHFASGSDDPATIARQISGVVSDTLSQPDVRALAVSVQRVDEPRGCVGIVHVLRLAVDTDPFPRVVEAGATMTLSGMLRGEGQLRGLYLNQPGAGVEVFEVPATGIFHLAVTLPDEPGAWRAAFSRTQSRRLPDSPYFFTLYAGVEPPRRYVAPADVDGAAAGSPDVTEAEFASRVNGVRSDLGLPPLATVDRAAVMREWVVEMPEGGRAQYRYVNRILGDDPFPDVVHGGWGASFGSGTNASELAWALTQHPVVRFALLSERADRLAVGAAPATDGSGDVGIIFLAWFPAAADGEARDLAQAWMREHWRGKEIMDAPEIASLLDGAAAKVAAGQWSSEKGVKKALKEIQKRGLARGALSAYAVLVPPGQEPDLSGFIYAGTARHLAIGQGTGNLGKGGATYTVLFLVALDGIR